jgi:hypothetical protein
MQHKLTSDSREALIEALAKHLDTRDKRFMFLKICFEDLLYQINIEGSPIETSWNIYSAFDRNCMLGSLMAAMNSYLDTDLYLETPKEEMT